MGTRSTIAFAQADGTVKVFYCHRNGHLRYNGKWLQQHFATPETAARLEAKADVLGGFHGWGRLDALAEFLCYGDFEPTIEKPRIMSRSTYYDGGWSYGQSDTEYAYYWSGANWYVLVNTDKEIPREGLLLFLEEALTLLNTTT